MAERLGDKAVGSIVTMNVPTQQFNISTMEYITVIAPQNFIVVHQGLPSSLYDSSCNGTWLLWEQVAGLPSGALGDMNYANSNAHTYLNGTFFNQLESSVQSAIQEVKIPHYLSHTMLGGTTNINVASGSSGLSTKVFLLSMSEITGSVSSGAMIYQDGAMLDYFKSGTWTRLTNSWWTRSASASLQYDNIGNLIPQSYIQDYYNSTMGSYGAWLANVSTAYAYRPAMILSPDTLVDDSGHIGGSGSTATSITGQVNIGGVAKAISGAHVNIGGVWKEVTSSYVNIGGVWKTS